MATFTSSSLSITAFNFFSGFHTMGGEHAMEHFDVCIGPNLTCMNDLLNRMGQFDHVEYNGEKVCRIILFFKNGPIPASFCFYFRSFLVTISIQTEKSIDGVLGIRTRGRRMVGADETTELWRPSFLDV